MDDDDDDDEAPLTSEEADLWVLVIVYCLHVVCFEDCLAGWDIVADLRDPWVSRLGYGGVFEVISLLGELISFIERS